MKGNKWHPPLNRSKPACKSELMCSALESPPCFVVERQGSSPVISAEDPVCWNCRQRLSRRDLTSILCPGDVSLPSLFKLFNFFERVSIELKRTENWFMMHSDPNIDQQCRTKLIYSTTFNFIFFILEVLIDNKTA